LINKYCNEILKSIQCLIKKSKQMKTQVTSKKIINTILTVIITASFMMLSKNIIAQGAAINNTGSSADPSAILDVSSTNAGMLIPRMTKTQRNLIGSPAEGLLIYQTDDTVGFWYRSTGVWKLMGSGAGSSIANGTAAGNTLYWDGSQWLESSNIYNAGASVGINTNSPDASAAIDVSSTTKGALIPRMTTSERDLIQNPAMGLQIFNLDCKNFDYFNGTSWVAINPIIAGVSISAIPGIVVCDGTSVTFTATPVNGGAAPSYQWKLNGGDVGTNSATYTNSSLNNGDQISCELTSNAACVSGNPAVSNVLTMFVSASPTVADAGTDQNIATATTTLAANTPIIGTGSWSVISGTAIIANSTSPISQVTGLTASDTIILRWRISNPPCTDSYDDVTLITAKCLIGETKEGGIVFYHDVANNKCYVSATNDQSSGAEWGCYGTAIGGTGTAIGTGPSNTTQIVSKCGSGTAADICNNLSLNSYTDWFLPSKDELNQMYIQRSTIGNFGSSSYWSSSENGSFNGWGQYFDDGNQFNNTKYNSSKVRCVRRY
jgi:hypothetical protein